jgi:hypothetical protein
MNIDNYKQKFEILRNWLEENLSNEKKEEINKLLEKQNENI